MTFNLYAATVALITLVVICIYGAAYAVISADVLTWKCDRERKARILTYCISLVIASFCFAVFELA